MKVAFSATAADELMDAVQWYEAQHHNLGEQLLDAVRRVVRDISVHPHAGAPRHEARQWPVPGFPYVLVYDVLEHEVAILAVAHTRRRPGYWRQR